VVDRSNFSCVGSVFHARGAATEKAVSSIRRRVGGTTRSPDDVSKRAMCERRASSKRLVDHQAQLVLDWTLLRLVASATAGEPRSHGHAEQYMLPHIGLAVTVPLWKPEDQRYSSSTATVR